VAGCLLLTGTLGVPAAHADDAANQAAARAEAEQLVHGLPLPPGAVALATPPADLSTPAMQPMNSNPVQATASWTIAAAQVTAVDAFAKAHPPAGTTEVGSGSSTNFSTSGQMPTLYSVMDDGSADVAYGVPEVVVSMVQHGSAVDVRADAFLSWRFARSAASLVTGRPRQVTIRRRPATTLGADRPEPTQVTTTHVRGRAAMRGVVQRLDALPGEVPEGVHSCPPQTGPAGFAEIEVTTGRGRWSFRETLGCSTEVAVRYDGHAVPPELDGRTFAHLARAATRS
jgi:hypothetical protein